MAWVEPKGAGFRVRHRYPDGTVETLGRYDTKIEARRHAKNFNADPTDPVPAPSQASATQEERDPAIAPTPSDAAAPPATVGFGAMVPAPIRPARRTAPKRPRQESPVLTTAAT